ncbi:MAG: DUF4352 domain-containing protein [Arthrobacter sp.]|jgi:hypothetical protein|nr:DUF4352 domain-containing protein [Arthrobacter sp.]
MRPVFLRPAALTAAAAAVVLSATACGGASSTPATSAAPTNDASQSAQSTPSASSQDAAPATSATATWPLDDSKGSYANPYKIGEEIADGDWRLTVDKVNLDGNKEVAARDDIYAKVKPEAGKVWVTVEATWKYVGSEPAEGATNFWFVDKAWDGVNPIDDDVRFTSLWESVTTATKGEIPAPKATPGFSVTGDVGIQVPKTSAKKGNFIEVSLNHAAMKSYMVVID